MYRLLLSDIFTDKAVGEAMLRASGSTGRSSIRPSSPTLPWEAATALASTVELLGMPKIARADVAHFHRLAPRGRRRTSRRGLVMSN
jgi:hypothetical protein